MSAEDRTTPLARQTYITFAMLIVVWILTWTLKVYVLDSRFAWLTTSLGGFAFWTAITVTAWILSALWRLIGISPGRFVCRVVR